MRGFLLYLAACLVIAALLGAIAWGFTDRVAHVAMMVSGALAVGVQLVSLSMARMLRARHLLLGWGLGSVLRLAALVVYALVAARVWQAALAPALLSFVGFVFVMTVVEPIFLKQ